MKKQLLAVLALFLLLFSSCKKENDESKYYLKFKKDGTWITWKNALGELGPDLMDETKTNLGISARDEAMKDAFDISLQVDGSNLTTGTYSSDMYFMPILYLDNTTTNSMLGYHNSEPSPGRPDPLYVVTITSITDKEIKGTFTGNYITSIEDDTKVLEITEGEFFVPRVR
ncbi:MAG TPA: hypothetical protein VFQ73_08385 [Flavisolibacter sp.]|nr:hypothetical protein [Flavisolibacter sp.]